MTIKSYDNWLIVIVIFAFIIIITPILYNRDRAMLYRIFFAQKAAMQPASIREAEFRAQQQLAILKTIDQNNFATIARDLPKIPEKSVMAMPKAWVVQLTTLDNQQDAQILAQKLRVKGYTAYVSLVPGKPTSFRSILIGPVLTLNEAQALAQQFRKPGFKPAIINFNAVGY